MRRRFRAGAGWLTAALVVMLGASCGGDPFGIDPRDIVGVNGLYLASTFMIDDQDVLAEGGLLRFRLLTTRELSGCILLPDGPQACSNAEARLEGTWEFDDEARVITLQITREIFLNELEFAWSPRRLDADQTVEETRYRIVMDQQEE